MKALEYREDFLIEVIVVDPWRTMGLASIEDNAPHRLPNPAVPPYVVILSHYPLHTYATKPHSHSYRCNTPSTNSSFFGLTHANMVHVSDMRVLLTPDSNHTDFKTVGFYSPISQEPFYSGLGLFQLALDEWLPCFANGTAGF